ncbi:hypothetical protein E4T38_04107 [Aureobasidium subglaciale]|nr:hypothetical protein E4T38_04107 [Aureobasidium subglaciale]KAI5224791.1 hypothetical protein E4T40_03882 [Aureobasidium subglaciale]KAI5227992.1 hypothetical protein E4T41_04102 [Aureobasidium subglaciale]KAI5263527.1 hypothetical protein E4T46_03723 [Aureobasidium subglaciale]
MQPSERKPCEACARLERTKACAGCLCSHYCSKECQIIDRPTHLALCKSFAQFKYHPRPSVRRAIYFPAQGSEPKFVWLEMDKRYAYRHPDLAAMRKTFFANSKDYLWPIPVTEDLVRLKRVSPQIMLGCSSSPASFDAPLNSCITKLIGGTYHSWKGSVLAYGYFQSDHDDEEHTVCTDLDTTGLTPINNWFLGRPEPERKMLGAYIRSDKDKRKHGSQFGQAIMTPSDDFSNGTMGYESQLSKLFGMPLVILTPTLKQLDGIQDPDRKQEMRRQMLQKFGNTMASLLLVDIGNRRSSPAEHFGRVPEHFLAQNLGSTVVVRKDGKTLTPAYLEAFCSWIHEDLLPKFADAHNEIMYELAKDLDDDDPKAHRRGSDLFKLRKKMWDRISRARFYAWCKDKDLKLVHN